MRLTKLFTIWGLLALALALGLTACGDKDRDSNSPVPPVPQEEKATFTVDIAIPEAVTKGVTDTKQLLFCLWQDNQELTNTATIFTAPGATPALEGIPSDEYTVHAAQGNLPRYYECVYQTDKVNVSNITLVIEYLDQSGKVVGKAFVDRPQGVRAGEEITLTSIGNQDFHCIETDPATMTKIAPHPIEVIENEQQEITITFQWDAKHSEALTAATQVTSADPATATVEQDGGKIVVKGVNAGTATLNITHQYGTCTTEVTVLSAPTPGPDIYTLVADFSHLTAIALPKDEIASVKFASHAAVVSEGKATAEKMKDGDYTLYFTDVSGKTYTTVHRITFAKESAQEGVITVELQDSDFPRLYNLILDYGSITEIFDAKSVTSVSTEIGNFAVNEDKTAHIDRYQLDNAVNLTVTMVALQGKQTAVTKDPVLFDPAAADEQGNITVELQNSNFPDYYHLEVDVTNVSSTVLDMSKVTEVLFGETPAYLSDNIATIYCVAYPEDTETKYYEINFFGQALHIKTKSKAFVKDDATEHYISVDLADDDMSPQNYNIDLDLTDPGFTVLGRGAKITKLFLNDTDYNIENGHVAFVSPLGTYTLTLQDANGNTYSCRNDLVLERPASGQEVSVVLKAAMFNQPEVTLSLDFNNDDVKKLMVSEPIGVLLTDDDNEIGAPVTAGTWIAVSYETISLTGDYTLTAEIYCSETIHYRLKDTVTFERKNAVNNNITVKVTADMIPQYKLQVKYGSTDKCVLQLDKISSATINGVSATIEEQSKTAFVATTAASFLPGTYPVVLECASGSQSANLTFAQPTEAKADTSVAQFTNANFPNVVNYCIKVTNFSDKEVVSFKYGILEFNEIEIDSSASLLSAYRLEQSKSSLLPLAKVELVANSGKYTSKNEITLNPYYQATLSLTEDFDKSSTVCTVNLDWSGIENIDPATTPLNSAKFSGREINVYSVPGKVGHAICLINCTASATANLEVVLKSGADYFNFIIKNVTVTGGTSLDKIVTDSNFPKVTVTFDVSQTREEGDPDPGYMSVTYLGTFSYQIQLSDEFKANISVPQGKAKPMIVRTMYESGVHAYKVIHVCNNDSVNVSNNGNTLCVSKENGWIW